MLNTFITIIITWTIFSILYSGMENTKNNKSEKILDIILSLPVLVPLIIIYLIFYPVALIYHSIKQAVRNAKLKTVTAPTRPEEPKETLNLKLPD